MKTGIYCLTFSNGDTYVGQSVDIENRMKQHTDKFLKGTAAKKMLDAYNKCGMPNAKILIECHKDYLDLLEAYCIHGLNATLNTNIPPLDPNINYAWLIARDDVRMQEPSTLIRHLSVAVDELTNKQAILENQATDKYAKYRARLAVKEDQEQLAKAIQKINQLQSRNWFQRLFNHQ